MTIVNFAANGWLAGKHDPHWLRKVLAVAAMGGGAFVGAVLTRHASGPIALCAAALIMVGGVVTLALTRRAHS